MAAPVPDAARIFLLLESRDGWPGVDPPLFSRFCEAPVGGSDFAGAISGLPWPGNRDHGRTGTVAILQLTKVKFSNHIRAVSDDERPFSEPPAALQIFFDGDCSPSRP